ncbi:hypothetical protein [uncultured Nostoc sp.]|nr:hypothetical protein [uncultured Nostoc sp.]
MVANSKQTDCWLVITQVVGCSNIVHPKALGARVAVGGLLGR